MKVILIIGIVVMAVGSFNLGHNEGSKFALKSALESCREFGVIDFVESHDAVVSCDVLEGWGKHLKHFSECATPAECQGAVDFEKLIQPYFRAIAPKQKKDVQR